MKAKVSDAARTVEVRTSSIHGRGVFALRRFRAGDHIGRFEGRTTRRDGPHVLWIEGDDGEPLGIRGENDLRFLNHDARPNAEFDGTDLIALRAIRPNDEITFHYGPDWD